jgi:AGCS family alanine or glycine:cation symporter
MQVKKRIRSMRIILAVLFVFKGLTSFGETFFSEDSSIVVNLETANLSEAINDAQIKVSKLEGGEIWYKWSKESLGLKDSIGTGFTEGQPIQIVIYNDKGDSLFLEKTIEPVSMSEHLNSIMVPAVEKLGIILFWDPFAAMGIYDPCLYDDNGIIVRKPNGDPVKREIPFIVVWLVVGALFFTFYFKFINFRGIGETYRLLTGKYEDGLDKDAIGEMSHFQALTTSLSATIGLGNIAGVAIAISIGGPGATLWMVVAGFLGMSSKFIECILGVKYREVKDGVISGGPMYYMSRGIKGNFGKILAVVFAILCVGGSFGGGNMFQSNQAFDQAVHMIPALNEYGFVFGSVLAVLVGVVIIGGVKSIARVTDKIVPTMAIGYVLAALSVIVMNLDKTPEAFNLIIDGAFSPDALKGGFLGVLVMGFRRAAFSNEAGVGSAPIAHAAVKTNYPASEGFVAMIGPFVDTVIVCLMTSLVIIFTGFSGNELGQSGAQLTSAAFESVFSWYGWVLFVAILLFCYSTMISWSYYGLKAWEYIFGDTKISGLIYKGLFLCFIIVGSSSKKGAVMDFSDLMILAMAVPNILALYILLPKAKEELNKYWDKVNEYKK